MNAFQKAGAGTTILPPPRFMAMQAGVELVFSLRHDDKSCPVLQVVSARNGEGVTAVAWDLALVAAGPVGLRVLLVAVEPSGSWPGQLFQDSPYGARVAQTRQLGETRLHVAQLEAGDTPAAWLSSLQSWREWFDFILLDAPALERSAAGVLLAADVDASLLVVAAETTPLDDVRTLRDRLRGAGGHVQGTVLNQRRERLPRVLRKRL